MLGKWKYPFIDIVQFLLHIAYIEHDDASSQPHEIQSNETPDIQFIWTGVLQASSYMNPFRNKQPPRSR